MVQVGPWFLGMVQALQLLLNCTARLFKRRNWNTVFDAGASTTIFAIIWGPLFSFILFQPPIMLFIIISSIFVKSRVVIVFYHHDFIMYEMKWKHFFQNSVSHHKYIIHSQNSFDTHFTWSWSSSNRLRWFHESQPWLFHLVIERNSVKCIIKYDYNIVNIMEYFVYGDYLISNQSTKLCSKPFGAFSFR